MTIIKGQIESLKRLRSELDQRGIYRFSSIAEINRFKDNFHHEILSIQHQAIAEVESEIELKRTSRENLQEGLSSQIKAEQTRLIRKKEYLQSKLALLETKNSGLELLRAIQRLLLGYRVRRIDKNFEEIINRRTSKTRQEHEKAKADLEQIRENRDKFIQNRVTPKIERHKYIKATLEELNPLIAGAIGEHYVVNELKKLSDDCHLYNDFSVRFDQPVYYKQDNTRIHTIQIDHVLVTPAGVFNIETKNWSKESLENLDLRSPIAQIKRTGYALFLLLNGGKRKSGIRLDEHHWGDKSIPVWNVVVMIRHKPRAQFKYVAVKNLKELNRYIRQFEHVLEQSEVRKVSQRLGSMISRKY